MDSFASCTLTAGIHIWSHACPLAVLTVLWPTIIVLSSAPVQGMPQSGVGVGKEFVASNSPAFPCSTTAEGIVSSVWIPPHRDVTGVVPSESCS